MLISMGALLVFIFTIVFWDRIYQIFYVSVVSRLRIMDGMIEAIRQKPVFGNGVNSIGNFTYKRRLGHNIYAQMWVEQGIIGLGILLAAIFYNIYITHIRMMKNIKWEAKNISYYFSLFIQVFIIIYGFFGNPIYDYNIAITYFLAIAAGFASDAREKEILGGFVKCAE